MQNQVMKLGIEKQNQGKGNYTTKKIMQVKWCMSTNG